MSQLKSRNGKDSKSTQHKANESTHNREIEEGVLPVDSLPRVSAPAKKWRYTFLLAAVALMLLRKNMPNIRFSNYSKSLLDYSETSDASNSNNNNSQLATCLAGLPEWVHLGPRHWADFFWNASNGKSDKVGKPGFNRKAQHSHQYQLVYYPYLSRLVQRKECLDQPENKTPLRFLEIGLGCNPQRLGVGGSALAWSALFKDIPNAELYIFEYDEGCARAWEDENPGIVTKLFTGDAGLDDDLKRAMIEFGNEPFDVIIDDGSHINDHQILGFKYLFKDWIKAGGLYIIEDIESSCFDWPANVGKAERGQGTGGTADCMKQDNGKLTILGLLVEYQKELMNWKRDKAPFDNTVTHIDIHWGAAVIEKRLD